MRKLFLILMTLVAVSWSAMAQNRTYSGTVVDAANNEPLIGATVMPIGGGQGAATDLDGKFTLSVPANVKSVKVSYVGYKEQTLSLRNNMTVRLASSSTNLDDVVVVAYGTANKESLTGSVAVVGAKEIEERPVTNVMTALEGAAPGVSVNTATAAPGSNPQIRIRGFNSFSSSAQDPLYVVDGVVYNGSIASINPADVESMSVLKDAASCALYGSRGANGVVLITTKKAKGNGKVDVNLQMNWGAYELAMPLYDRLGANDWMEASLLGLANGNAYANNTSLQDALNVLKGTFMASTYMNGTNVYGVQGEDGVWTKAEGTQMFDANGKLVPGVAVMPGYTDLNWWDAITRTGTRQEYNLNAAGGSEKFDVFASMGYLTQDGYVLNSDYKRFTGRLNSNFRPTSYLKVGMNLAASYSKSSSANVSASNLNTTINPFKAQFYSPVQSIYEHDANGNIVYDETGQRVYNIGGMNAGGNLIWGTLANKQQSTTLNIDGNIYGTAVLPYGFEATVRGSLYRSSVNYNDYSNNQEGSQKGVGGLDQEFDKYYTYTFSQAINWSHEYGLNHIDVLLHHENFKTQINQTYYRGTGQKLDGMYTMGNFDEISAWIDQAMGYNTESYLGRARYNYDQKYFAEFSLNRDGSSQFHKDRRWGTFWSVGASWIVTKEKFMQATRNWLNYLKLRLAYGSVGNNQNCSYYNYLTLFEMSSTGNLTISQLAAPELKWESTNTLDVALEGSLFNDRFTFSVGYFDKRNADLIYALTQSASVGTLNNTGSNPTIYTNIGEMKNYGWELQFGVDIIRNKNVTWNFNIDASFIKNEIVKLPYNKDLPGSGLFQGMSRYENYTYDWAGTDMTNGRSLYRMHKDSPDFYTYKNGGGREYNQSKWDEYYNAAKADGTLVEIGGEYYTYDSSHAGRVCKGTKLPTVYGSFGSNVSWKGLHAGFLFTYSLGGKVADSNWLSLMGIQKTNAAALHKDVLSAWVEAPEGMTVDSPNRINSHQLPQFNSELSSKNYVSSSMILKSASFLTLKNVNVSYDLPSKWCDAMKLQNINIGFQMENAFILTSRKGFNSASMIDGVVGSSGAYYQPARTYIFSLGVKF